MSNFSSPSRDDGKINLLIISSRCRSHNIFPVSTSTIGSAGGSRRKSKGTPKQPKTGPFVLKNKLYFHEKEEVPVLKAPAGFVPSGTMKFYVSNHSGLKSLYFTTPHEDAMEGVGIGILRSTGAGKVYVDTSAVDDESEIFWGFKLTLDEVEAMIDQQAEEETASTATDFGLDHLTVVTDV